MKRRISLLLLLVLLGSLFRIPVAYAYDANLSVSMDLTSEATFAEEGELIPVELFATDFGGMTEIFCFGPLVVSYNEDLVEFVSFSADAKFHPSNFTVEKENGVVSLLYANQTSELVSIEENDRIGCLYFRAKSIPSGRGAEFSVVSGEGFATSEYLPVRCRFGDPLTVEIKADISKTVTLSTEFSVDPAIGDSLLQASLLIDSAKGVSAAGPIVLSYDAANLEYLGYDVPSGMAEAELLVSTNGQTITVVYLDESLGETPLYDGDKLITLRFSVKDISSTRTSFVQIDNLPAVADVEGNEMGVSLDSDSFLISLVPKTVTRIAMASAPVKTEYLEEKDAFDPQGGKIKVYYNNEKSEEIDLAEAEVVGFDNTVVGKQLLTVSYEGKTTSFEVEIIAKKLVSIAVTAKPDKNRYLEGKDLLDLSGGKLTLSYDNDTAEEIKLSEAIVTGFDNSTVGTQRLTVVYNEKTTSFEVEIVAKKLVSISVTTLPHKVEYTEGADLLDLSGGKLTLLYNNGTSEEVNLSEATVYGFDNTVLGEQTLTVTYREKVCTFPVVVKEAFTLGDADGDGIITSDDASYLLGYTLFPQYYPVSQPCDFNGDGKVNSDDATYLLGHTLFPNYYPLH